MDQEIEIRGTPKTKKLGIDKELRTYKCGWCHYEFKTYVCKSGKQSGPEGKRGDCSTQVVCPNCKNFLKTWESI